MSDMNLNEMLHEDKGIPPGSGKCAYCERDGFPILPVRYAICQMDSDSEAVPGVPEGRVSELFPHDKEGNPVELNLDASVDSEGEVTYDREKQNKYILRKLRGGFLYVYDEGNQQWLAYAISDTAELKRFTPDTPPEEREPSQFSCNQDGHREHASLVTLGNVTRTGVAWFAYVESPWSRAFLDEVASDAEWRQKNMQRFDVDSWLNTGQAAHAFPQDSIAELVPEYIPNGDVARYHLSRHYFPAREDLTGEELNDLQAAMDERIANSPGLEGKVGKGVVLAIKDEVGIVEELNHSRQKPIEEMREFQRQGDNARRSQWLAAVTKLKKALEDAAQDQIASIDSSVADEIKGLEGSLDQQMQELDEHWQEKIQGASPREKRAYQEHYDQIRSQGINGRYGDPQTIGRYIELTNERSSKIASTNEDLAKTLAEFSQYYDDKQRKRIEEALKPYENSIDSDLPPMDADYAQWVVHGLSNALDRYDHLDTRFGLRVTEIVNGCLQGGALTSNSKWAWQVLMEQLHFADSPLLRAYLHNNQEASEKFAEDTLELQDVKSFFGKAKLKDWYDQLKRLRKVANNHWGLDDFTAARKALSGLGSTIFGGAGTLMNHESAAQVSRQEMIAPRTGLMLQYARLLQVDRLVSTPDGDFTSQAAYVVEMDVAMGEYSRTMNYLAKRDGSPVLNGQDLQYVDPIDNGERRGGNLPGNYVADESRVKVLWQVQETELERFAAYVEGSGDITEGGAPRTLRITDQYAMLQEQRRLHARLWSGDNALRLFDAVFAMISFYDIGKSLASKPNSLEHWLKLMGTIASVTQLAFEAATALQVRRGLALGSRGAASAASIAARTSRAAARIGKVSSAISILDGFRVLSEAVSLSRRGAVSTQVQGKTLLGSVMVFGGVVALAASSLVVVPLVLGIITLIISYQLIQLVPLNIRTWLRRSLFGLEQERFRFIPFASAEEEQASLQMVFSGIVFDMDIVRFSETLPGALAATSRAAWGEAVIHEMMGEEDPLQNTWKLSVSVELPSELEGELRVQITHNHEQGLSLYLGGAKYSVGSVVEIDQYGQEVAAALPQSEENRWMLREKGNSNKPDERSVIVYNNYVDMEAGEVHAEVGYRDGFSADRGEVFIVRL
ncbi:hypothetical protein SAMN05660971_04419 [Halomonas cupida]|uniref:Toxin VasX N-terminal region domain-containing protein n=1 Tax=Halomonas cupida TaxID=44933 RepID=A0A1M7N0C5_9GAMM|nr:hypothetical protein SAMN05660971_04419 [Halomonas cupida]